MKVEPELEAVASEDGKYHPKRRPSKEIGTETTNANGYTLVKLGQGVWKAKHVIIAEEKYGRTVNTKTEMVRFVDGDRSNLEPDNIQIVSKGAGSLRKRLAALEARRDEVNAEIDNIKERLGMVDAPKTMQMVQHHQEVE